MSTTLLLVNCAQLPDLHGTRCSLRPLMVDHVTPKYVKWLEDPEVNRCLESRFAVHTIDTVRAYVASQQQSGLALFYGIWSPDDTHIGNIKVGPIERNHLTSDIGFLIGDHRYWGKGIASEAIALLVAHGFSLGLKKVTAGSYETNPASAKALKKSGFQHEGFRPNQVVCEGRRVGIHLFGISCS